MSSSRPGNICSPTKSSDIKPKCVDTISSEDASKTVATSSEQKSFEGEDNKTATSNSTHFSIRVYKDRKIHITKALIPLKLALFLYFGAGSFMSSFVVVIYKQRGVTLQEISAMTAFAPIIQFLGTTISGVVADKIGRAKPVLVANLLLSIMIVIGILVVPRLNNTSCNLGTLNVTCHSSGLVMKSGCYMHNDTIEVHSCKVECFKNITKSCNERTQNCRFVDEINRSMNFSASMLLNRTYFDKIENSCSHNVYKMIYQNQTVNWCNPTNKNCYVSCETDPEAKCPKIGLFSNALLVTYASLFILFLTFYTNTYRCLDVTAMFLVHEHNSDFGHERAFGFMGSLLISPFAGYIADVATPPGGERNYSAALYLYIVMICLLFFVIYKLPVRVKPPGEKMWMKILKLLKNLDVVLFLVIMLILGTAWNFSKYFVFWYLDELNAPSVLLGLVISVGALYGLPFLLTAKWWVSKIGTYQIFILSFLAHAINSLGYSFLQNPWFSLILEATGIVSYFLLWVAVVQHSHDLAPEGLQSTVIAIAGGIHFSVGKSTSGLIGGLVMNKFGGRFAFMFNAVMCFVCAVVYGSYVFMKYKYSSKTIDLHNEGGVKGEKKTNDTNMLEKKL